jgi:hypothetical protein
VGPWSVWASCVDSFAQRRHLSVMCRGIDRLRCGGLGDSAGLGSFGRPGNLNLVEVVSNFSRSLVTWVNKVGEGELEDTR